MPSPSKTSIGNLFARAPRAITVRIIDATHAIVECRGRSAKVTRDGGRWLVACTNAKGTGDPYPINDWADVCRLLAWVAGPHVVDANGDVQRLVDGSRLEVDDPGSDDYDRGTVSIDAEGKVFVDWERAAWVQCSPVSEFDGMVIHEPAETIHWWHEWPASEDDTAEAEAAARAMDDAAWAADRGCR